jgi:transcriptional regulator with XRE-family HTH domain
MRKPFNHDPEAVTRAREDAGLNKTQVAKALNCSLSLVSEIESGTRNAQMPLLTGMADLFGCALDNLLASTNEAKTA